MSLIRKPNELNVQTKIKMLIYGQPGIGKSTLALSAPNPLLIDFDGGINRVNYAHIKDTVQVESYEQFLDVLNKEDLSAYDTIVIDTGGKMLDMMAAYIVRRNPKMGRSNGMLTQTGYGERKAEFIAVNKLLVSKNKDIVYIAHRQTTKDKDDEVRYVPLFGGSNYDALVTDLDLVGYMEANGNRRTITFEPTSHNDGKNTCNMPPVVEIPLVADVDGNPVGENDYLSVNVFKVYRDRLVERSQEGQAYKKLMEEISTRINEMKCAENANAFAEFAKNMQVVGNSKEIARQKFSAKIKELQLIFDKEKGCYIDPAPANEEPQEAKEDEPKAEKPKAKSKSKEQDMFNDQNNEADENAAQA